MSIPHVVVIGAGVVGLSTAIKAEEAGYKVTIIAECIPGDPKSIRYTSPWAGAHHVSLASDERQISMDRETFKIMWDLSESRAKECFLRLQQTEYYDKKDTSIIQLEAMPNFEILEDKDLVLGSTLGMRFNTVTIDVPVYLLWLLSTFQAAGGQVKRACLQHISQAATGAHCATADAVIVCAGLGARSLGGVEDKDVYPIRGQTVLVNAPWIRFGRTHVASNGDWTYIIPRHSGEVILGGTKVEGDWHPAPRSDVTENIMQRCLDLCPELLQPPRDAEDKTTDQKSKIEELRSIVIEEGCGLRPARKGGIRLERSVLRADGREIPVVYNYGHGGYGYQSSWGSAILAVELLKEALGGVAIH